MTDRIPNATLRCAFCKRYLFVQPRQAACGERLCGNCYDSFKLRWACTRGHERWLLYRINCFYSHC